jgi:transposase
MSKYSTQFKQAAIQAFLKRGRGYRHVAAQFHMDPSLLRRWVTAYRLHGEACFDTPGGHYAVEFKHNVLHHKWREQLSLRATAALFNLGSSTLVRRWEEQYYSDTAHVRNSSKEMSITAMPKTPRKPVEQPSRPLEELTQAQLIARLRQLEAENAYLKKLEELDEEKARMRQARKKPG